MIANPEYYKITKDNVQRFGNLLFKYIPGEEWVTEINLGGGEMKKGKTNRVGIYQIHKSTYFANYMAYSYLQKSSASAYHKSFKKAVEILI